MMRVTADPRGHNYRKGGGTRLPASCISDVLLTTSAPTTRDWFAATF